jgi:CheY-like chemotaxis protein
VRLKLRGSTAWVESDPVLLERILGNLVGNALRYTRHGGVLIGCRRRNGRLRLEIWDTGIGIPRDKHGEIFAEFYQVAPPGRVGGDGLGLGLAIVSRLCRLLGHEVEVVSSPGRGSRFSVSLPEVPARPRVCEASTDGSDASNLLQQRCIVVIDNDSSVLESTAGLLRAWGCNVVAVRSAAEALERLGMAAPDLVVADIHLDHGEDGVEAVVLLRQHYRQAVPALLVSGDVTQTTRERAATLGLQLLEKPVAPLRLRTLSTRLINAAARIEAATSRSA